MYRRLARERALQVIFQVDLGGGDPAEACRYMDENFGALAKEKEFSEKLVFGTLDQMKTIDRVIAEVSREWKLERISCVDLNIMRMALYEIFFCEEIPPAVSVNEAVELGKIYGTEDSGRFINGILGHVVKNLEKYRTTAG